MSDVAVNTCEILKRKIFDKATALSKTIRYQQAERSRDEIAAGTRRTVE
jgi:hypothetical protein